MLLRRLAALACAAAAMWAPSALAEPSYLDELLQAARAAGIARGARWHALMRYEPDAIGSGVTSLADGARFFLAPGGREDPEAELEATLAAFLHPGATASDGTPVRCAFPARYRVLDGDLRFDSRRMPSAPRCEDYERWVEGMRPAGLTLVFPEAYMNNPASMFGHTLLRVDSDDEGDARDMLAYAVNFAAESGRDGGAAFAFKGLTGFYSGYFSVVPYYAKLKQYGDWENRDIWEYRLNFTPEETALVLEHVWELRGVSFPYYFFDDNCSFHLLGLLEVGRPGLRLSTDFPLWAIPVDTVRTIAEERGLISAVQWRPSPATRLRREGSLLPPEQRRMALDVSAGRERPDAEIIERLRPEQREAVLALSYEDLRYRYLAGDVSEADSRPRSMAILQAVSRAGTQVDGEPGRRAEEQAREPQVAEDAVAEDQMGGEQGLDAEVAGAPRAEEHFADERDTPRRAADDNVAEPRVRPEQGHPSARLSLAGGVRDDDAFVELRLRPVFHELTDPVGGYAPGAQIVIMDSALRWEPERDRVRLEEVVVVDVTSIAPRDDFIRPISWHVSTALRTRMLPGSGDDLDPQPVWRSDGGAGLAWEPLDGVLTFGFAEAVGDVGGDLEDDFALGVGASVGVLAGDREDRTRLLATARATRFVLGDTTTSYRTGAAYRVTISRRTAIELEAAWDNAYGEDWLDARLTFKWFFRRNWNGT